MLNFTGFPGCCSVRIVSEISIGTIDEFLTKAKNLGYGTRLPVLFTDNAEKKTSGDGPYKDLYKEKYGVTYIGLGGFKLAEELRKKGFRVDQINLGAGNHGTPVFLWIWWPQLNHDEGQKPSRINYVEERKEQLPKSEPRVQQSAPEAPKPGSISLSRPATRKGTGVVRRLGGTVRRLAKRPRTGL